MRVVKVAPDHEETVVLANALYHNGPIVEATLTRYQIRAHRLPPYSPRMNATEPRIRWAKEDSSAYIFGRSGKRSSDRLLAFRTS